METGKPFGLTPGHMSSIRRIEAAMLSFNADVTLDDNPHELGMGRLVDCDVEVDFIGKKISSGHTIESCVTPVCWPRDIWGATRRI